MCDHQSPLRKGLPLGPPSKETIVNMSYFWENKLENYSQEHCSVCLGPLTWPPVGIKVTKPVPAFLSLMHSSCGDLETQPQSLCPFFSPVASPAPNTEGSSAVPAGLLCLVLFFNSHHDAEEDVGAPVLNGGGRDGASNLSLMGLRPSEATRFLKNWKISFHPLTYFLSATSTKVVLAPCPCMLIESDKGII